MTDDYIALANITLSSAVSSVTFSAITGNYRDLVIVGAARSSHTSDPFDHLQISFNEGEAGTTRSVRATGGSIGLNTAFGGGFIVSRLNTSNNGNTISTPFVVHLVDYSVNNKFKSAVAKGGSIQEGLGTSIQATTWQSTSPITSMRFFTAQSANFVVGSTFDLYGIPA